MWLVSAAYSIGGFGKFETRLQNSHPSMYLNKGKGATYLEF